MARLAALDLLAVALLSLAGTVSATENETDTTNELYDPSLYGALEYRLIGPYRGGRVTAVTGVPKSPFTFYMGTTGGGVWETRDAGETWKNISDGFLGVASIGAIDVSLSDPNIIYVGTGSACPRGNISVGDGVYKSTDAGKTWTHVGLREAGQIGRVRIHPDNPDLVYVAALGHIFGTNAERGVFRSKDGGKSWEKVLFVSERTGAIDLSMNPKNPRQIYAAMWRAERKPWTLIDGAEEGGLYKTSDGGDEWEKLAGGLPEGLIGRIGVSMSPANPNRVWALVTARDNEGGVHRSDDAGETWKQISKDRKLQTRGWYYSHIYAHPRDENTVYVMNGGYYKSIDGGKAFSSIRVPHGDNHDMWINPEHPKIMVQANDGGANVSLDEARSWSTQFNQPTAEFYRVTVDNRFPYRVYGAQQDNSTISVPSRSAGGVTPQQYWYDVAGGESGHIAVSSEDPDLSYAGNYIGRIDRYDRRTGQERNVIIYPQLADGVPARDLEYRFPWNAPIVFSAHEPEVLYHTSNYVHRTRDRGMSWETISGDLTRNDPEKQELPGGPLQHDDSGVEVYDTIFAFAESPHTPGVLWAGTDDGLVHISRDNGEEWTNITPEEMPEWGTVNTLEVSPHQAGRVFIAVYKYRWDDFSPYVFRTDDYGASWKLLTDGRNGIPDHHPVRVVREDPDRKGLLYAGTEYGMFVSFDDGLHWQSLQLNLPVTQVADMKVHEKDLVVATHGRSFWILDDLTPLHEISDEVANAENHLFQPRAPHRVRTGGFRGSRAPDAAPAGAIIHYYLAEKPEEELKLEILDSDGNLIRTHTNEGKEDDVPTEGNGDRRDRDQKDKPAPAEEGMNRFVWDLKYAGPDIVKDSVMSLGYTGGAYAAPGKYQVRLSIGDWSHMESFDVLKDPRLEDVTQEDLDKNFELVIAIRDRIGEIHDGIRTIRSVRKQLEEVAQRAEEAGYQGNFSEASESIREKLTAIEEELIQTKNEVSQDPLNFPPKIDNQFVYLYGHVNSAYGLPTEGSYQRFEDLNNELAPHIDALRRLLDTEVKEFNKSLREQGVPRVIPPKGDAIGPSARERFSSRKL